MSYRVIITEIVTEPASDGQPQPDVERYSQVFDTLALPKVIAFLNAPTRKLRTKKEAAK